MAQLDFSLGDAFTEDRLVGVCGVVAGSLTDSSLKHKKKRAFEKLLNDAEGHQSNSVEGELLAATDPSKWNMGNFHS